MSPCIRDNSSYASLGVGVIENVFGIRDPGDLRGTSLKPKD